jgi:hypothetical protein
VVQSDLTCRLRERSKIPLPEREVSVAVLVRAAQDAVGAVSGWLLSPALLARVVEQRLNLKARKTQVLGNNALSTGLASQ